MVIAIYGASSQKIDGKYISATEKLGRSLSLRGHSLVFGGGATGLMGAAARGVSGAGGKLVGVAPKFFPSEGVLFEGCTELIRTETMSERKALMAELADAFVIAPGGIGTLDEFFDILSTKQLGRHGKPIALFSVDGYWEMLCAAMKEFTDRKFISPSCSVLYGVFSDADRMLDYLESAPTALFTDIMDEKIVSATGTGDAK